MARRLLPSPTAPEARLPIARAINISPSMSAHEPRPRPATTGAGRSRSCHPGCSTGPTPASRPLPRHHTRWPGTDHARGGERTRPINVPRRTVARDRTHIRRVVRCSASLRASSATFCQTPADEQEPRSRGSGAVLPPPRRHSILSQVDPTATRAHAPATRPRRQPSGPFLAVPYTKTRDERLSDGPRLGGGPTARALVRLSRASSRTARHRVGGCNSAPCRAGATRNSAPHE